MVSLELQNIFSFYQWAEFVWILLVLVFFLIWALWISFFPQGILRLSLEYIYEKIYLFFDEVIGEKSPRFWVASVTALFCVLLGINIFGVFLDILAPIFGHDDLGNFVLSSYIAPGSSQLNFTVALALISVWGIILTQFQSFGAKDFFLSYIPVTGKGYITIEKPEKFSFLSAWAFLLAKIADIFLGFFLAFLDIIGIGAKVVALSFRLFGNMLSGAILWAMLLLALGNITEQITQFVGGIRFPILFPLLFYIQSFFVAFLQAFVFALLVSIFIRVSMKETS
jgi:F0F1-type ATP synthase membrane subunit a